MVRDVQLRRSLPFLLILAAPASAWAQAEPAPPDYIPPGKTAPDPTTEPLPSNLPRWHIALAPRLMVPLGHLPPGVPPVGWGAGLTLSRALISFGRARIGFGVDFAYDRAQRSKGVIYGEDEMTHKLVTGNALQVLSHATLAAQVVLDGLIGRVRPYLAVGIGADIGQYQEAAGDMRTSSMGQSITPGQNVSTVQGMLLGEFQAGLDVAISHGVEIGVAATLDLTDSNRSEPSADAPKGKTYQVFAPGIFSAQLEIGFRF